MIHEIGNIVGSRPIIGYGCGEIVDRALGPSDLSIEYFVDDERAGGTKWGVPIVGLDRLGLEARDVVIFVFSRHISKALLTLARFGYAWRRNVFDGRFFGLAGAYCDEYALLAGLPEIAASTQVDVYLGPEAHISISDLVLPRGPNQKVIQIFVGAGARLELRQVVVEEGVSIFAGNRADISIGEESIIRTNSQLSASAGSALRIGRSTLVSPRSVISAATGVSIDIGDGSTFGEHLQLYGYAPIVIGKDCMFSGNVYAGSGAGHDLFIDGTRRFPKELRVGDHVWVGMGAALLAGSCIGSGSVIGAMSVLNHPIGGNVLAVGNPARVVRESIVWTRDYTAYKDLYHHVNPKNL